MAGNVGTQMYKGDHLIVNQAHFVHLNIFVMIVKYCFTNPPPHKWDR